MKVRIIKANEGKWYLPQIGSILNVVDYEHSPLIYRLADRYNNGHGIDKSDCEIISETETTTFKPRMMWVSDYSEERACDTRTQLFVVCKDTFGRYIAYHVEKIEDIEKDTDASIWVYAVDIEEQEAPEFTDEQVAYLDKHYIKK